MASMSSLGDINAQIGGIRNSQAAANNAAAFANREQAKIAREAFGLKSRQFDENLKLRSQLLNFVTGGGLGDLIGGISGNIGGGLGGIGGGFPGLPGGGGPPALGQPVEGGSGGSTAPTGMGRPNFGGGLLGTQLGELFDSRNTQRELVGQFGDSHRRKLDRDFDASANSALSDLEARGLGSSNLRSSTRSAIDEGRAQASLGLEDNLLGRRLDVERGATGDFAGALGDQLGRNTQLAGGLLGKLIPSIGFNLGA